MAPKITTERGIEWSVAWSVRSSTARPDLSGGGAGTAEAGGEGEESGGMGDTVLGDTFVGHGERVSSSFISPSRRRLFSGSTGSMEGILAGSTGSLEDILSRTHQRMSDRSVPPVGVMSARSRDWREAYLVEGRG